MLASHLGRPAEKGFEPEFSIKPADNFVLYLRNGAKGFGRYDDVTIEEVGPAK